MEAGDRPKCPCRAKAFYYRSIFTTTLTGFLLLFGPFRPALTGRFEPAFVELFVCTIGVKMPLADRIWSAVVRNLDPARGRGLSTRSQGVEKAAMKESIALVLIFQPSRNPTHWRLTSI